MIKLIASDMDGTLLNSEGELSPEFFEVYELLKKKDIKFVAASGRQYYQLMKSFEPIKDEIYFIAENGTFVRHRSEELYVDSLSPELAKEILSYCLTLTGIYIVVCGKNSAYVNTTDQKILEEFDKYYFRHKVVENLLDLEDEILKIAVLDVRGAEQHSAVPLREKFGSRLQVTVSGPVWIDIYNFGTNKGTAIRLLQQRYGISEEETMVFGDYYNDVELLKSAYYSFAMGNAPEGVKQHARFIAKSNDENGVIQTIRELVLSEDKLDILD